MTSQIISYIIGTAIGIIVVLLIDIFWWSIRIREMARGHIAEIDAEEREREAERRNIPRPEKPEDVTVEERECTFITMDNKEHHLRFIGLYCKGKLVNEYETRTEAEAARLQYLYDNGVTDKEDFTL